MEEEADGLPVHEELPGDVAGAAADEEGDAGDDRGHLVDAGLPGDVAGAADDEEGDAVDAPASESFMPEHEPHVQGSALHACQDARRENKRGRDSELEAIGGARSRGCAGTAALHAPAAVWGPPLLQPSAIRGVMTPLHVAPGAPC